MKKAYVIHPFLLALFPILFVYAQNLEHMSLSQVWKSVLILLGVTLVSFLLLAFILRNVMKAGLVVSLFLLLFFSYGPVHRLLWGGTTAGLAAAMPGLLLVIWAVVFGCVAGLIIRAERGLPEITRIVNVMALALVLISVFDIGLFEISRGSSARAHGDVNGLQIVRPGDVPAGILPDIYYIILDGYARADVLAEVYGVDNSDFLEYLGQEGFFIAREGRANYAHTALSLAANLNMDYLDRVAARIGPETFDRQPMGTMIKDSAAVGFLRQNGYTVVAFPTGYTFTEIEDADYYMGSGRSLNEFEIGLLLATPVPWLVIERSNLNPYAPHRDRIRYTLDHLTDTAQLPSPHFVFAHIVAPHPPFVLDELGNAVEPEGEYNMGEGSHFLEFGGTVDQYRAGYAGQLAYINDRIRVVVGELLYQSSRPAIIILQADHGPGLELDWDDPANTNLKERLAILNAYLLPGEGSADLYDGITPVNTFRVIFNRYFGTDLELLKDDSFFSTWDRPYEFIHVTDDFQAGAPTSG